MHDDSITSNDSGQSEAADSAALSINNKSAVTREVEHSYVEVSGDLMAKPAALCAVLEALGARPTAVFCNSPSDTDLVEVLLRKHGIGARKLIGHVSPLKVERAVKQLKDGEISVIVLTDIAAESLNLEDFELIINYALNSDPEVYLDRMGRAQGLKQPTRVLSLIAPLDVGNFHYLKKTVPFQFKKDELPSAEQLVDAKVEGLRKQAERAPLTDEKIKIFVDRILASPDKTSILGLLVHNTFDVIPNMRANAQREESRDSEEEGYSSYNNDGGGRGYGYSGRDRGDRGDRGERGDRGDRGGDRGGDRRGYRQRGGHSGRGRNRYDDNGNDEYQHSSQPAYQRDDSRNGPEHRQNRERRAPAAPLKKDVRFYFGQGSRSGLNQAKLAELVAKHCNLSEDQIARASFRECYAFADFHEEIADTIETSLNNADLDNGEKLYLVKAVTINAPRKQEEFADESGDGDAQPQDDEAPAYAGTDEQSADME